MSKIGNCDMRLAADLHLTRSVYADICFGLWRRVRLAYWCAVVLSILQLLPAVLWTVRALPVTWIYYEAYLERDDALGRERYLKSGSGRKFLKTQLRHYLDKDPFAA